jgi:hypothetical protein
VVTTKAEEEDQVAPMVLTVSILLATTKAELVVTMAAALAAVPKAHDQTQLVQMVQ